MLDLNLKREYPLFYRIMKIVLLILTWIIAILFAARATWFVISGPSYTLLDDLSAATAIQTGLLLIIVIVDFIGFSRHLASAAFTLPMDILFILVRSIASGGLMLGALEISLLAISLGYLGLGLFKRWWDNDGSDKIIEPLVEEIKGPNIHDLKL